MSQNKCLHNSTKQIKNTSKLNSNQDHINLSISLKKNSVESCRPQSKRKYLIDQLSDRISYNKRKYHSDFLKLENKINHCSLLNGSQRNKKDMHPIKLSQLQYKAINRNLQNLLRKKRKRKAITVPSCSDELLSIQKQSKSMTNIDIEKIPKLLKITNSFVSNPQIKDKNQVFFKNKIHRINLFQLSKLKNQTDNVQQAGESEEIKKKIKLKYQKKLKNISHRQKCQQESRNCCNEEEDEEDYDNDNDGGDDDDDGEFCLNSKLHNFSRIGNEQKIVDDKEHGRLKFPIKKENYKIQSQQIKQQDFKIKGWTRYGNKLFTETNFHEINQ